MVSLTVMGDGVCLFVCLSMSMSMQEEEKEQEQEKEEEREEEPEEPGKLKFTRGVSRFISVPSDSD